MILVGCYDDFAGGCNIHMALYAMSDLHLSLSASKPMDVFGPSWHNYMEKIYSNWNEIVTKDDTVVVGGDISWAMYLEDAYEDLKFLDSLPGKKLIMRGNHDYWWQTLSKMKSFFQRNGFSSIDILQNNAFVIGDKSVSGTRGWILPSSDSFRADDRKIYERELIRLSLSLDALEKEEAQNGGSTYERIVVLHYPPVNANGGADRNILEILRKYSVKKCIYGHLHGNVGQSAFCGNIGGIEFRLVSSDYLKFIPCNLDSVSG